MFWDVETKTTFPEIFEIRRANLFPTPYSSVAFIIPTLKFSSAIFGSENKSEEILSRAASSKFAETFLVVKLPGLAVLVNKKILKRSRTVKFVLIFLKPKKTSETIEETGFSKSSEEDLTSPSIGTSNNLFIFSTFPSTFKTETEWFWGRKDIILFVLLFDIKKLKRLSS